MNAFDFLKWMRDVKRVPGGQVSNSEIMRWLNTGSVVVNGEVLTRASTVTFSTVPMEVVFFPKGKKKCTTGGFQLIVEEPNGQERTTFRDAVLDFDGLGGDGRSRDGRVAGGSEA